MANKLSIITTQYHTYKVDQVLTHTQLNESISFFEDQDRLTRVFLNGVGIVCGFKLSRPLSSIIRLTQGIGVTTDGDLLKLLQESEDPDVSGYKMVEGHVDYTHYRLFEDKNSNYEKFKLAESKINLWKIVPEDQAIETDQPLSNLEGLADKIALLYLETYALEADMCSGINCDNQGVEQVARLHVLLTDEEGAKHLMDNDGVYQKLDIKTLYSSLKKIKLKRVLLSKANTQDLQKLEDSYYKAIMSTDIDGLADGMNSLSNFLGLPSNITERLKIFLKKPNSSYVNYFQYQYDWLRDVISTYHEIVDTLYALNATCLPDIDAFPKHIMLGRVTDNDNKKKFRHGFYKSPITGDTSVTSRLNSLLERMKLMLFTFQNPNVEIAITPSVIKGNLGDKAIPFYYKDSKILVDHWNYDKTQRGQTDEINRFKRIIDPQSNEPIEPLEYDSDEVDFYRIEGHQGKSYNQALINIMDKIKTYNLDFDVKALSINQVLESIKMEDYKCHFEDLMLLMEAWNDEISCITGKISQFFSSLDIKKLMAASSVESAETVTPKVEMAEPLYKAYEPKSITIEDVAALINSGKISLAEAQRLYPYLFEATKDYKTESRSSIQESISKNISSDSESLGIVFDSTIKKEDTPYYSYNDIKVAAEKEAVNYIKDIEISEDYKKAFIDKPIEIIAASYDISNYIPERLFELDDFYIDKYETSIESLCNKLKEFSKSLDKLDISDRLKSYYQSQALFYSSICCAANKLKILQAEIDSRKKTILEGLQLSNFLEHHPGLDHQAGVTKGGTFVLVYFSRERRAVKKSISGLSIMEKWGESKEAVYEKADYGSIAEKYDLFKDPTKLEDDLLTLKKALSGDKSLSSISGLTKGQLKSSLKDGTVMADFMLPYRCCSDCSPINFIVPRPVVYLNLSEDTYCLGLDQAPIGFEVIPVGGTIKVVDEVPGVIVGSNAISIDASLFPIDKLGQPINFTVNDEPTSAKITVYQSPVFALNLPDGPVSDPTILFSATPIFEEANYVWDFGDGTQSTDKSPQKVYQLPVNDENKLPVSLTITPKNGACPSTVTGEIIFEEPVEEVRLDLNPREICRDAQINPIAFTVVPEDGVVTGEAVQNTANGYVFNPLLVSDINLGKELKFKVNGQETDLTVRVYERPNINFTSFVNTDPTSGTSILSLSVTTPFPNGTSYHWFLDDKPLSPTTKTNISQKLSPDLKRVSVRVMVELDNVCEQASSETITIDINDGSGNCIDEGTRFIQLENKRFSTYLNSEEFKNLNGSAQDIFKRAIEAMDIISDKALSFVSGEMNTNLSENIIPFAKELHKYILEMDSENGPEMPKVKDLYKSYVKIFYTIIKCQDTSNFEKFRNEFETNILKIISDQMVLLKQKGIKLDIEGTLVNYYSALINEFDGIDYIQDAIRAQAKTLS
ncbi:PKD domain-containing protein [Echinicola shivajiensis]|uniref:PKD domain-containing protein n=1 Tax=Echinicola shivajiensis TaxID=1035916 RepID=UPI001BFBFE0A|nr:PKD domain-containing protein [Echinicola shivajiensis]